MKKQILLDNLEQLETKEYTKLTPILVPENWEDLKDLCKDLGDKYMTIYDDSINLSYPSINGGFNFSVYFNRNGEIDVNCSIFSQHRTPQQMWQIIKGLVGEKK